MFKIDKKVASVISAIALTNSIILPGCNLNSGETKTEEQAGNENVYIENSYYTAVYQENEKSIIIPISGYNQNRSGLITLYINNSKNEVTFSDSDLTIFYEQKDSSSYEQAYNFASALSNEVYLYEDVISGNPINLVVDDRIQKEMGITK